MKSFLINLGKRNGYLALAVVLLFSAGYIIDYYVGSSTSAKFIRNDIQSYLQEREIDFVKFSADTSLVNKLFTQQYSNEDLKLMVDKNYSVLLYQNDSAHTLKFWNNQRVLPDDSLLQKPDGNYFAFLKNGQYDFVKKTISQNNNKPIVAVALVPVRFQYYITINNLQPEFVNFPEAEGKFAITFSKNDLPVKSYFGNNLFYLHQKLRTVNKTQNWISVVLILSAILLLLIIIQNVAQSVAVKFGAIQGIAFLMFVVTILRVVVYKFPSLLNLRQYELFDPRIYGSNFILSSLGDLLINSLLSCWIILFIRRQIKRYNTDIFIATWKEWLIKFVVLTSISFFTFVFAYIVQSLVADAKISFNVTNFWSLSAYSFIGFIVLASLALTYFFCTQMLIRFISTLGSGDSLIEYIIMAFAGLLMLTFIKNTEIVELDVFVLIWLLAYTWLMQRKLFSGLNVRLNISEVLFWLFTFSVSISAVIISENRKIELEQRKRTAERLSEQADPSTEKVLSIALTYFDNDFLYPNFKRLKDPEANAYIKDSLINKSFSTYRDNYNTKVYTYGADEKPLFNEESISYDTLNTIFKIQGKPTSVTDLRYYEKAFDKYTYLYKKSITDSTHKIVGYFFILSEPKNYKGDDLLVPELFQQRKEFLPEYSPVYSCLFT